MTGQDQLVGTLYLKMNNRKRCHL